jgi:ATP/maltotriose-dependent transcriptional regulator MalT
VHLEILELDASALALDEGEVAQLLPPDRRTAALRREARGWPAVIALAAHARLAEVDLTADSLSEQLYDYLAEELFESAGEEVCEWLATLAVLPPLRQAELDAFLGVDGAARQVLATGLAYGVDGRVDVHPLAREFLLSKLRERDDAHAIAMQAFELSLTRQWYAEAFIVAEQLKLHEGLERLIVESYGTLVETGRLRTLARFGRFAENHGDVSRSVLDLVSAELALTEGRLEEAQAVASRTAEELPADHKLKPRSYLVAGRAAHLRLRFEDSFDLHRQGRSYARTAPDFNASIFGMCFSALYLEDDRMETARKEIQRISVPRAADRLRVDMFRSQLWMYGINDGPSDLGAASALASDLADPWVRSAWSYLVGTTLMLKGRYQEAAMMLRDTLKDLRDFGLAFALPRVRWSLAAAELGLRQFARCESDLRIIERHPDHPRDIYAQLNTRALRARLHLAQHRPHIALELTADEFDEIPSRAMYGEYLATRALSFAAVGESDRALAAADRATKLTRSADAAVLAAAARAVVATRTGRPDEAARTLLQIASGFGLWDGVVCAIRAFPEVLGPLSDIPRFRMELRDVLIRSSDTDLARAAGLVDRSTGVRGTLSPREREVLDHLSQGQRNAEIATSLVIEVGTVKRHLVSAYKKLGAKNRTEAVARYAEIDIAATDSPGA